MAKGIGLKFPIHPLNVGFAFGRPLFVFHVTKSALSVSETRDTLGSARLVFYAAGRVGDSLLLICIVERWRYRLSLFEMCQEYIHTISDMIDRTSLGA